MLSKLPLAERTQLAVIGAAAAAVLALMPFLGLTLDEMRTLLGLLVVLTAYIGALVWARARFGAARVAPIAVLLSPLLVTIFFFILHRASHSFWILYLVLPFNAMLLYGARWSYVAGTLSIVGYLAVVTLKGESGVAPIEVFLEAAALLTVTLLAGRLGKVQEQLRDSEAKLQPLFAAMTDVIAVLDARGRYLEIAPSTPPALLCKPRADLLSKTVHQVFPAAQADLFLGYIRRALKTRQPVNVEYSLPIGDAVVWFAATVSPLREDAVLWVARDITERKRAEEELQRQLEALTVLHAVAAASAESTDVDTLIERATEIIGKTLYPDNFGVLLLDEAATALRVHPSYRGVADETLRRLIIPLGQGVTGRVAATGKPWRIADVSHEPGYIKVSPEMRSELCVPLQVEERVIGVINAESAHVGAFSEADERLLATLAGQLATGIQKARLLEQTQRLHQETQQRAERLSLLNRIAGALSHTLNLDELLDIVYREVVAAIRADAFFIVLYDRATNELDYPIRVDKGIRESAVRQPLTPGLTAVVLTSRQPLLIRDFEREKEHLPPAQLWGTMEAPASWLGVPLLVGADAIGVINVQAYRPNAYGAAEQELLSTIADTVAVAIQNARLFETERQRAAELEAVRQASLGLTARLDLPTLLNAVLESTLRLATGVQDTHIFLYENDRLTFGAALWADGRKGQPFAEPRSDGLTYTVARQGQPIIVPDMHTHPLFAGAPPEWSGTIVGLPLKIGERVVGVMNVAYQQPRTIAESELHVLRLLADQAAIAIENARLFDETQRRATEFAALYETVTVLSAQQDLTASLQTIAARASLLLNARAGFIYLYDPVQGDLELVVSQSLYPKPGTRLKVGEGMAGRVAQTRQPLIVDDYRTWEHRSRQYEDIPFTAVLEVPMLYGGELIGVLGVDEIETTTRKFTEADVHLLSLFASQAASAVHDARLLEETRVAAQQFGLLYDAGLTLNRVLDPRQQLEFLCKIAMKALHAERAQFFRYDAARNEIHFELGIGYAEDLAALPGLSFSLADERGLAAWVARNRLPLNVPDLTADPRYIVLDPEVRSGLWVPVQHEKELRGVLGVLSTRVNAFTPQDERLLVLFANQVSVAMENARLFAETQRHARESGALYEMALAMGGVLETPMLLRHIYEHVQQVLVPDTFAVALYDADADEVEIALALEQGEMVAPGLRLPLDQAALTGWVIRTRQALLVGDMQAETLPVQPMHITAPARAWLGVPLIARDRVIGALSVQSFRAHAFDENQRRWLESLASQVAIALENARLFEETRQRAERQEMLYRLNTTLARVHEQTELCATVVHEMYNALGYSYAGVLLLDPATGDRVLQAQAGWDDAPPFWRLHPGEGLSETPLLTGRLQYTPDVTRAPRYVQGLRGCHSEVDVPIQIGETRLGVLVVEDTRVDAFREEDFAVLQAVANQLAVALESARLFEETQRRAVEQRAVSEIARALNATLDVRQAFPTVVRELCTITPCERVSLALLDESRGGRKSSRASLRSGAIGFPPRDDLRGVTPPLQSLTMVALDQPRPEPGRGGVSSPPLAQGTQLPITATSAAADILAGRVHLTADLSAEVNYPGERALYDAGFRSRVNVPLVVGERVIGALNLASRQVGAFTAAHLPPLQQIASALAIAIENTRLFEVEQSHREELIALYSLSRDLADLAYDLDSILALITRRAVEMIRVTFAHVMLLKGDEFVMRAAHPARVLDRDLGVSRRAPVAACPFCQHVLKQNTPVVLRADGGGGVTPKGEVPPPLLSDDEREMLCLDLAQTLCLVPLRVGEHVLGLLTLGEMRHETREPFSEEKLRLARSIGDQTASALHRAELFAQLENSYLQTVLALANAVDAKDTYTANHAQHLAQMALAVGREVGMTPPELEDLRYGAILHDIGKIGIPDTILQKPAKLDPHEWTFMRRHPVIGAQILQPIPRLAGAAKVVRHHHERYDGTGYPDALAGEAIPLGARVLGVVDSYSAITDKRVYKEARSRAEAIAELQRCAGTQFDPRIVEIFLGLVERGMIASRDGGTSVSQK